MASTLHHNSLWLVRQIHGIVCQEGYQGQDSNDKGDVF